MNDDARLPDDELASAYLDGELSADERALVDASPALTARVTQLAGVRDEIAEVPVAPAAARDAALAAALAEFDALPAAVPAAAAAPVAPVVRLRPRWTRPLLAAAAAVLFVGVAGVAVLGGRGSDDKASTSADKEMSAERSTDGGGEGDMSSTGGGASPSTIASITGSADAALQIASTEELLALAEMRDDAGTTMETMAASETSVAPAADTYAPENDQSLACPLGADQVYLADILWMGTPAVAVLDTTTGAVSAIAADCTVLVTATP